MPAKYDKEEIEDPSYTSNIRSPFPAPKGEESLEQPKEEMDPQSAKTLGGSPIPSSVFPERRLTNS